jgi:hypothetical protein
MRKSKNNISPGERERIAIDEIKCTVTSWWLEFESSKQYRKLAVFSQNIMPFVAYVTMVYLFRSESRRNRDCSLITEEDIQNFFFKTAPDYITVDEPVVFVEATIQWLQWLCRKPGRLIYAKTLEKLLNKVKKDAVQSITNAKGTASKSLILQALSAGVDVANNDDILNYFIQKDPRNVDYYEEFLHPPHPIFNKRRMLYLYEWPPEKDEL